jgi:F0F1-type ATP synthase membrane subunit b/b'
MGGFVTCVSAGITNYARYGEKYTNVTFFLITLAILFVSGTVITFLIYSPIYKLNQKRQKKIEEKLDKEESDIKS